jgi:heterodisulfide reductase subunit C
MIMKKIIENFQLKKVLLSPFVKKMVWQVTACYKCTPKDFDIILISIIHIT